MLFVPCRLAASGYNMETEEGRFFARYKTGRFKAGHTARMGHPLVACASTLHAEGGLTVSEAGGSSMPREAFQRPET
jgi:hypothetical protein